MKVGVVNFSEIAKDPHLRLTPSLYLEEKMETKRPIHRLLSAGKRERPDCVDVCEETTKKLLKAGFKRRELGLDKNELDHSKILGALEESAVVRKDSNFTKTHRGERILWCALEDDAQQMAQKTLGRRLTLDELRRVKQGLEYGLGDWWISLEATIKELDEEL